MVRERRKPANKEVTLRVSDTEKVEMAERAAELRKDKAMIAEQFARTKADFKGRIEAKESEISELLTAISEGKITKKLEVVEVFDLDAGQVEVEHNGEVIEVRNMTAEEREQGARYKQPELPLSTPPAPSAAPSQLGEPEPWIVTLPDPKEATGPVHVPGEPDRPTKVKYLEITWRQEAGEAATYEAVDEDVFGTVQKQWRRTGTLGVSDKQPEPPAEEQAPPAEETPQ